MSNVGFVLNGRPVEVEGLGTTTTLLRYLRDHLRLCGTKEGCAEGDCGACTVAVLESSARGDPTWRAVNACLIPVLAVAGKQVVTVEGLAREGTPHRVQERLVHHMGSQCGYCTPGVIMSMFEACHRADLGAPWKIDDQMCGNLCRCTGYRPIRAATVEIAGSRPDDGFRDARPGVSDAVDYVHDGQRFVAPTDWVSCFRVLADVPEARLVCGATDLGLEITKGHVRFDCLVSVERLPGLRQIQEIADGWSIGAAVSLSDVETWAERELPMLARMLRFFGSRQVKNRASLGGNLCNGSPIGDTPPALLALGARVVLRSTDGERSVPLDAFFLSYRQTALRPGEVLSRVEIPRPPESARLGAYKVSKRRELDISAVAAGMYVEVDDRGQVTRARLAYGGMAATPCRAPQTEARLVGRRWNAANVAAAAQALDEDFSPLSDHRGSSWYRATVARNLLLGFFEETRAGGSRTLPDRPVATVVLEESP